jgi:hypothetical protein
MALTLKTQKLLSLGGDALKLVRATADASYPAGGYPLTKTALGMVVVDRVDCSAATAPGATPTAYGVRWDNQTAPAAPTLRFFTAAGAEVATAASLAGVTCDLAVFGA